MKRAFAHGKWPMIYVRTHWFALTAFCVLLVTGLLLFLPQVHTVLIPVLPLLLDLHITAGILLGLALLLPLVARLPKGKRVRRLDWIMTQVLLGAITLTGLALWLIALFPATWRGLAFTLHGDFAYIMAGWIVIHFAMRLFSIGTKARDSVITRRVDWSRRHFLRYSALGVLGSFVALAVGGRRPAETLLALGSKAKKGSAIPPFPEYYTVTGSYPALKEQTYRLQIDGLVGKPLTLTLADLKAMPQERIARNFQCVTGWVVPNLMFTGVSLREVIRSVAPTSDAKYVTFFSADGVYTESLTMAQATVSDVLLLYAINGEPLPVQQGYPLRLFVPEMYGYKSIKWLNRIRFDATRVDGYWEQNGYPANAYIGGATGVL